MEEKLPVEPEEEIMVNGKISDHVVCKKLVQLRQSALSRGIEFDLCFSTVKRLLTHKKCFYTGVLFSTGDKARSIDRLDPGMGYVEGNVVACTVDINSKKANLTIKEIIMLAEKIQKHINSSAKWKGKNVKPKSVKKS